jgi:hypothetical protein
MGDFGIIAWEFLVWLRLHLKFFRDFGHLKQVACGFRQRGLFGFAFFLFGCGL